MGTTEVKVIRWFQPAANDPAGRRKIGATLQSGGVLLDEIALGCGDADEKMDFGIGAIQWIRLGDQLTTIRVTYESAMWFIPGSMLCATVNTLSTCPQEGREQRRWACEITPEEMCKTFKKWGLVEKLTPDKRNDFPETRIFYRENMLRAGLTEQEAEMMIDRYMNGVGYAYAFYDVDPAVLRKKLSDMTEEQLRMVTDPCGVFDDICKTYGVEFFGPERRLRCKTCGRDWIPTVEDHSTWKCPQGCSPDVRVSVNAGIIDAQSRPLQDR